jgi:hypothetical protein
LTKDFRATKHDAVGLILSEDERVGPRKMTFYSSISGGSARARDYRVYVYDGAGNLLQRKTSRSIVTQTLYGINSLKGVTH